MVHSLVAVQLVGDAVNLGVSAVNLGLDAIKFLAG